MLNTPSVGSNSAFLAPKDGGQCLHLPCVDLRGVYTVLCRQFVGGLLLPDGFHRDFGLELASEKLAFLLAHNNLRFPEGHPIQ
jgi:hypothetical protein